MFNWKKSLIRRVTIEIEPQEQGLGQEQASYDRIQIATCVLLLEVAKSNDEFTSIEQETVSAILKKEFQIPAAAAEELMEIAHEKREQSVGLYEFTSLINEKYTREEKIKIIELAWKVIYADRKLDMYEDHLIHRLAKLLSLRHDELIEAKLRVLYED